MKQLWMEFSWPDQAGTFCVTDSVLAEVGGLVSCKDRSCKIFKKLGPEGLQVSEDILVPA